MYREYKEYRDRQQGNQQEEQDEFEMADPLENFPDFSSHKATLLKESLTEDMYSRLSKVKTKRGMTIDDVIQVGVDNQGNTHNKSIGTLAGDEECYVVFAELLDKIIDAQHGGFGPNDKHRTCMDASKLTGEPFDENYVKSSRVRGARNIRGLLLPPKISRAERRRVEKLVKEALGSLGGEYAGNYSRLRDCEKDPELVHPRYLFRKSDDIFFTASGMNRDWPDGRGIWLSEKEKQALLVWLNEEDHMRIISMAQNGDMRGVFERWSHVIGQVESQLKAIGKEFMWNERLGFISSCPSNLGTGLRCGVHVRLRKLSKDPRYLDIVKSLNMQSRGTSGEETAVIDDTYDLSNAERLGKTEVELVQIVIDGVHKVIEMEKALEAGKSIDDLIAKACGGDFYGPMDFFPDFSSHKATMLTDNLTPELYCKLHGKKTARGLTLDDMIQVGVDNQGHTHNKSIGTVVGDEDCYEVYAELLDKIIADLHGGYAPGAIHPVNMDASQLKGAPFDENYVKSSRVRGARNIRGYLLPPQTGRSDRREVEKVVTQALASLTGDYAGKYTTLRQVAKDPSLVEPRFLFRKSDDIFFVASGMNRDWPDARGIWVNDQVPKKALVVWLNEEDHTRIISMSQSGDMKNVFERWCHVITQVESQLKAIGKEFMRNNHLGFISTCPSNLGTGLRCGVHVRLRKLAKDPRYLDIVRALNMQSRGTGGEETPVIDDTYDLSNRERLGKTEVELVQLVVDGVHKIIEMEKALEAGKSIDAMIPK